MKQIDDQQLDQWLHDAAQRRQMLTALEKDVMREVKQAARRARWRKWRRMVLFSFGLPLALVPFGLAMSWAFPRAEGQPAALIGLVCAMCAVGWGFREIVRSFSLEDES